MVRGSVNYQIIFLELNKIQISVYLPQNHATIVYTIKFLSRFANRNLPPKVEPLKPTKTAVQEGLKH